MQTLFEGMAVGIFDIIQKGSMNPLLSDVIRRVKQDEARHAAFGILTMRRVVREATPEEMAEMEDFAFNILETLNANQQLDMLRDLAPKYGLDPESVVLMLLGQEDWARFNSDVFMIAQSRLFLSRAPWTIFCPGIALALVVLAVNLLGDGLRDRLDPRLARRM